MALVGDDFHPRLYWVIGLFTNKIEECGIADMISMGIANRIVMIALLIAAIIHLLPAIGMLGVDRLSMLYQVSVQDANLEILLRHRAVLFALLGGYLAIAAFRLDLQTGALFAGVLSVLSFLLIAHSVGHYNAAIARVWRIDWMVLAVLLVGIAAHAWRLQLAKLSAV
jgi:hypothetical protein